MSVTAAEIITGIRYEIKDTNATNPNFSDAELLVYISDAVHDLVQHITGIWPEYWFAVSDIFTGPNWYERSNIFSGLHNYQLPNDWLYIVHVTLADGDGNVAVLDNIPFERRYDDAADGYYLEGEEVCLYPEPDEDVPAGLTVYYIPRPSRITNPAETVMLSDQFRLWYREYAVLKCKGRQEETPDAFAALFARLQQTVTAVITRTNMPTDAQWLIPRHGWFI